VFPKGAEPEPHGAEAHGAAMASEFSDSGKPATDAGAPAKFHGDRNTAASKLGYFAGAGQEIRVPLNGILGTIDLLRIAALNPEQSELVGTLARHANTLVHLVNDLIDLARMETDNLELEVIDFDLRGSLESALASLSTEAEHRGLALRCTIAPDVPAILRGDPGRLKQALYDLTITAMKATVAGEVFLEIGLQERGEQDGAAGGEVALEIQVRGSGIAAFPERIHVALADPARAEAAGSAAQQDAPLSLVVARRIARMMKGDVLIKAGPSRRETLRLVTCLEKGTARLPVSAPVFPGVLRGLKALLVDTNATNREMLRQFLEHWGVIAEEAGSTAAALGKLTMAAADDQAFRLVLLDDGMCGPSGFDLAQQIKQRHDLSAATVVLLTSTGVRGDAARCRQIGVSAYLTKPIRPSRLLEALALALGNPITAETELITRHSLSDTHRDERAWPSAGGGEVRADGPGGEDAASSDLEDSRGDLSAA
jgi:CheY-like chemotaxis protein